METSNVLKPTKQVYRDIINMDQGGPRHPVQTPRNAEQV